MRALLFSGGLDSSALAYWLRPEWTLTINYGQRAARGELRACRQIAESLSLRHTSISVPISDFGTGDLSGNPSLSFAPSSDWWPCRNQQLITVAVPWALRNGIDVLLLGCVANDRAHGDTTPEFVGMMNALLSLQKIPLVVEAPAIHLSKAELIRRSGVPLNVLAMGHSCHTGEFACGHCRACNAHRATMEELGFPAF